MKTITSFFIILGLLTSCKKELVKEPKRLIEKEKMINIIYDLALLDAMRADNPAKMDSFKNNASQYIYSKYKIDSLQFAKSNSYYAADVIAYEKMYTQVKTRIEKQKNEAEVLVKVKAKKDSLTAIKRNKLKFTQNDSAKKENLQLKNGVHKITKRTY